MISTEELTYFRSMIGRSEMDACTQLADELKGKLDEQELIMLNTFGFEYLRDFVAMREEQSRQLTERKELLEYLQTQPALMQLLKDILLSPSDIDNADVGDPPIRRTKMLRIIRAWKKNSEKLQSQSSYDDSGPFSHWLE